jgi:dTDP-4-amino-4,6-dideoxygalactose transaminase
MIPFNKPYLTGKETEFIEEAIHLGKISGNGQFTKKCQDFFQQSYGFKKCLLTTSCTDALEMAALLLDIKMGDEIIVPSYTFVSSALAFVRQGAKIVFADSRADHPGIDEDSIEEWITPKTKAIVVVHYAGVACDMDKILALAKKYDLFVVEDSAHAFDGFYKGRALGSIGHLGCFSFHETKNIQCGEGGMLTVNDERFIRRAEIIWEKGTNRAAFSRGEVNKYNWVDIGSSFLPSEISAVFLWAQIGSIRLIQDRRKEIWKWYDNNVHEIFNQFTFKKPFIPEYSANNAHMYYLVFNSGAERTEMIDYLKRKNIHAVFHYLCLHKSPYYRSKHDGRELVNAERYEECLLRLPLYFEINMNEFLTNLD